MSQGPRAILWLGVDQIPLGASIVEHLAATLVAAGSPERGRAGEVARALGAEPADDLRALLASAGAELLILMHPGDLGHDDDVATVLDAAARGMRIVSLEPIPASAFSAVGAWGRASKTAAAGSPVRVVPSLDLGRVVGGAGELLDTFGPARAVAVRCLGSVGQVTTGAHLHSAIELCHGLVGEPESVFGAFVGREQGLSLYPLPGESLRGLHGEFCAILRCSDGRTATILAGDQAGEWSRRATLFGANGTLEFDDQAFRWIGADGAVVDEGRGQDGPMRAEPGAVIAEAVRDVLRSSGSFAGADPVSVLATAQAALLSARTGQPESPETIRRMAASA